MKIHTLFAVLWAFIVRYGTWL